MDSRQIEAFVNRLTDIINNVTVFSSFDDLHGHQYVKISESIALIDDAIAKYDQLMEQIWKKLKCNDKFTREGVNKRLKDLVSRLVKENDLSKATDYLEQFVDSIENYNTEQIIYLPIDNIEMPNFDKFKIGNISIVKMTDKRIKDISGRIKRVIEQTTHPPEHKPLILENLLTYHVKPLKGKICVEYRLVAEPEIAEERAREEALSAIDLLRYAIPSLYRYQYPAYLYPAPLRQQEKDKRKEKKNEYRTRTRIGIGLQGEVPVGMRSTYIFPSDKSSFEMDHKFVGMRPLTITKDSIDTMKKIGVFKLAKSLQKPKEKLTSFEDVLLRSIHWFANAQVQFEIENELLNLVTSLETILTDKSNPLIEAVSYGIAFVLGSSVEQREELIARYREIYDERSNTSHHGIRSADEVDLIELRYIAQEILRISIKNLSKWREHEQLLGWVKRKKLQ